MTRPWSKRLAKRIKGVVDTKKIPLPPRMCATLHGDIAAFAQQLRETERETAAREETVARATMVLQTVCPGADVHVFGSAVTDLRLPFGDVDLMIAARGADPQRLLPDLASALRHAAVPSTILTVMNARVPIIKWTDKLTGVKVDACVNNQSGLRTSALLRDSVAALDKLRPITLVVKSQHVQRRFRTRACSDARTLPLPRPRVAYSVAALACITGCSCMDCKTLSLVASVATC